MSSQRTMAQWVESIQSRGRYTFTRLDAESDTGRSFVATQTALRRLKEQGRVVSPRRGFYVIVPPEYRATGAPPASWFIDDLMSYLGQPYYVGLLSAAALHGAAHQQPMVFQVVTDRPTRGCRAGGVSVQFVKSGVVEKMQTVDIQTETGTMRVASPETTAVDLVRYPAVAGHLSNVATVLAELSERIEADVLAAQLSHMRVPDVQRLGYLLDSAGEDDLALPLADWLETRRPRVVPLRTGGPAEGTLVRRWHVLVNEELEADL